MSPWGQLQLQGPDATDALNPGIQVIERESQPKAGAFEHLVCTEEKRAETNRIRKSSILVVVSTGVVTLVLEMMGGSVLAFLTPLVLALAGFVRWLGLIAAQSVRLRVVLLAIVRWRRRRGRGGARRAPDVVISGRRDRRGSAPSRSRGGSAAGRT